MLNKFLNNRQCRQYVRRSVELSLVLINSFQQILFQAVFRHKLQKMSKKLGSDVVTTGTFPNIQMRGDLGRGSAGGRTRHLRLQHMDTGVGPHRLKLSNLIFFLSWHLHWRLLCVFFQFLYCGVWEISTGPLSNLSCLVLTWTPLTHIFLVGKSQKYEVCPECPICFLTFEFSRAALRTFRNISRLRCACCSLI